MNILDGHALTERQQNPAKNLNFGDDDENGQASASNGVQGSAPGQIQAPLNDEKMKQLKQFIHMIDLLNGLEEDQRQHYQLANE